MERAADAGVVELRDGQIAFGHPLFASTVYHAIGPDRRRALHRRLAEEVRGTQERARQLSLAADGPDEMVAVALDEAATTAAKRGAPSVAADFAEQASSLTPLGSRGAGDRRKAAAAAHQMAAGNLARARELLEGLASSMPPGTARADALRQLATVRYRQDSPAVAAELLTHALAEAGHDTSLKRASSGTSPGR